MANKVITPGLKLRARYTIRYIMGQVASDKICRGEIITVEKINDNGKFTLVEHADRYGPWDLEDFKIVKTK
jgi:hypothetical protein